MKKTELTRLLKNSGKRYTEQLDINVDTRNDKETFKWFLAAVLFGAPITESSVLKTYKTFEKHNVLTPQKIVETGWDGLVEILDEGSYTRYDFKTATKLLLVMGNLNKHYAGSLNQLHREASDPPDLEKRLKELGKGIGEITVSIFLRELRNIWTKADPKPTPLVIQAAKDLGIIKNEDPNRALTQLKAFWKKHAVNGMSFINFETALLRLGRDQRRKTQSQD